MVCVIVHIDREMFVQVDKLNFQIETTSLHCLLIYLLPHSFIDVEDPGIVDEFVVFVPAPGYQHLGVWGTR